jgi:hypothetical protein
MLRMRHPYFVYKKSRLLRRIGASSTDY